MAPVTLFIPRALAEHPFAPLLLNKAVKVATARKSAPECVVFPFAEGVRSVQQGKLLAECARLGLGFQFGATPESGDPLVCTLDDAPLDLTLPEGLYDWHAHTQFAYCGRGIEICSAAELALMVGVRQQGFAEHTFALYFPNDALKFYWQSDLDFVRKVWEAPGRGRMVAYREFLKEARKLFGARVKFGLEVDLLSDGTLCLAPEDRAGWDMLIGAIHEVPGVSGASTQAEAESAWMRDVERLLSQPIHILAHPFRYWSWGNRPTPRHLYKPVAKLLAQAGVAAEINHHKNPFDVAFFRLCLEEGVKLSLGTDAHITRDIADLHPHLETLEALGLNTPELREQHVLSCVRATD